MGGGQLTEPSGYVSLRCFTHSHLKTKKGAHQPPRSCMSTTSVSLLKQMGPEVTSAFLSSCSLNHDSASWAGGVGARECWLEAGHENICKWLPPVTQRVENPPAMQETQVQSLGQEDPLGKEVATHSSILGWESPRTEEPGGVQFMGRQSWTWLSN